MALAPLGAAPTVMTSAVVPAIRAQGLCRHYPMGNSLICAVEDVALEVATGEFAALLGSSGSGKSTLLNLVAGLDRPTAGSISVFGHDLASLNSEALARHRRQTVGIVFQAFNLIGSMTVLENVELPLRFNEVERGERRQRALTALERVGLADRLEHRPSQLSGGEQQRVSLARAIVNRPALLLADEPTGNLDTATGESIMLLLRELNQSLAVTVLMVTHERPLADRFATRLLHMADGRLRPEVRA